MGSEPVIIVGAGPTGLALAVELQRRGVAVRLLERSTELTKQSRALGIQARTLEIFEQMGVYDRLAPQGSQMSSIAMWSERRKVVDVSLRMQRDDSRYLGEMILPQNICQTGFLDRLRELGGEMEANTRVTAVNRVDEGFALTIARDGKPDERISARWLVACDGARSLIRTALDIPYDGATYEETVLVADCMLDWDLAPDRGYIFFRPQGTLVAFPYPTQGRWRLIDTSGTAPKGANQGQVIAWMNKAFGAETAGIRIHSLDWFSNFRFQRRIVPSMRDGGLFLLGDAAHTHTPAGGQGMNTGVQDAFNLGWKLAMVVRGEAKESILDSFNAERWPVARKVLQSSHRQTVLLVWMRNRVLASLRNLGMKIAFSRSGVREKFARGFSKLDEHYRGSPIVSEVGVPPSAPVHAGDRVPDLLYGAGQRRLHDLLRGTGHTLLLIAGEDGVAAELGATARQVVERFPSRIAVHVATAERDGPPDSFGFPDHEALWRILRQPKPSALLVRPDQMIGYLSHDLSPRHLLEFLASVLTEGAVPSANLSAATDSPRRRISEPAPVVLRPTRFASEGRK